MIGIRQIIAVLLLGFLALLLQGTFAKLFSPTLVVPNLLLIITVFLSFYQVSVMGVFLAFLVGLQFDICSGLLIGPWAGSFVVIYGLIASLSQRIFIESTVAIFVATFCSSLIASIIYAILVLEVRPMGSTGIPRAILEALFTAVLAPLVFRFLRAVLVRDGHGEGR